MNKKIYASVLLKDNKIMAYSISPNKKEYPHDFYKTFYYAGYNPTNCDEEFEVRYMEFGFDEKDNDDYSSIINNHIFDNLAKNFFRIWKIHPEHFGSPAYEDYEYISEKENNFNLKELNINELYVNGFAAERVAKKVNEIINFLKNGGK